MAGLRVVLIGKEPKLMKSIEEILKPQGYLIIGRAADSFGALKVIHTTQPDLIILDGDLEFIEVAKTIDESLLAPSLILVDNSFWQTNGSVFEKWEFNYLEKPLKEDRLGLAISITVEKYDIRFREAMAQVNLKSANTTRNMVNRAMEFLAESSGISQTQALNRILIISHERKISVRNVAKKIMSNIGYRGIHYQAKGIS